MVKIRELSDKQLVSQLEKYEKIYTQLVNEREKRVTKRGGDPKGLLTAKEEEERVKSQPQAAQVEEEAPASDGGTKAFHLKFDDSELSAMQEEEERSHQKEEEDEVRVTQLLKLSKEQLEELRSPKPKKSSKRKKS